MVLTEKTLKIFIIKSFDNYYVISMTYLHGIDQLETTQLPSDCDCSSKLSIIITKYTSNNFNMCKVAKNNVTFIVVSVVPLNENVRSRSKRLCLTAIKTSMFDHCGTWKLLLA